MSDCRFGVSPVNYPDPDITRHDVNSMYVTLMAFDTILMECYITKEKGM